MCAREETPDGCQSSVSRCEFFGHVQDFSKLMMHENLKILILTRSDDLTTKLQSQKMSTLWKLNSYNCMITGEWIRTLTCCDSKLIYWKKDKTLNLKIGKHDFKLEKCDIKIKNYVSIKFNKVLNSVLI